MIINLRFQLLSFISCRFLEWFGEYDLSESEHAWSGGHLLRQYSSVAGDETKHATIRKRTNHERGGHDSWKHWGMLDCWLGYNLGVTYDWCKKKSQDRWAMSRGEEGSVCCITMWYIYLERINLWYQLSTALDMFLTIFFACCSTDHQAMNTQ